MLAPCGGMSVAPRCEGVSVGRLAQLSRLTVVELAARAWVALSSCTLTLLPHGAPSAPFSDLDLSIVWAETAASSRFLHMASAWGIGEADEALTWIG